MNEEINEKTEFEKLIDQKILKKKRKNIFKISLVGFIFLLLIIYMFTPLSQVRTIKLAGNLNLQENQILEFSSLKRNDSLYFIDAKKIKNNLEKNPLIDSCEVKVDMGGVKINIDELTPVLKVGEDYYLNDGSILDKNLLNDPILGTFLNEVIKDIPTYISSVDNLTTPKIESFSRLYFMIEKDSRSKIEYVRFYQEATKFSFIYQGELENYELTTNFPLSNYDYCNVAKIFQNRGLSSIESNILHDSEIKKGYTLQNLQINDSSFDYYAIKVIMNIVQNGDPSYTVAPNNTSAIDK